MSFPLIVAHRGYSALAPENTLVALRMALDAGAPACEVDVHLTADDQLVVMHDHTVDRTTDGSGAIRDMAVDELRSLDAGAWKDPKYAGEPVPLLTEVLDLMRDRAHLILEIKDDRIEEHVAHVLAGECAVPRVTIVSFSYDTCRRMRQILPGLAVLWLIGGGERGADELATLALEGGLQGLSVHHKIVTEGFFDVLLRRGLSLWAWTVNDDEEARRLAALGIPSITSDDPVALARALA